MKSVLTMAAAGLILACSYDAMPEPPEGEALYQENCAMCHGLTGRGDGPIAGALKRRPPDLTRITRRNGGAFPRARIMSQIDGYTRADMAGQNMPEFGNLLEGPTVPIDAGDGVLTPTPRPLAALMVYLESIQE